MPVTSPNISSAANAPVSTDLNPMYYTDQQMSQLLNPSQDTPSNIAGSLDLNKLFPQLYAQSANQQYQPQGYAEGGPVPILDNFATDKDSIMRAIQADPKIMKMFAMQQEAAAEPNMPLPKRKPIVPPPDPQTIHDMSQDYAGGGHVEPSEAQKEAGNYKKTHYNYKGMNLAIENEAGTERRGKSKEGKEWSVTMPVDYGYIKRTEGADGDHVDAFVGPDDSDNIHVIDQRNPDTGEFDEHKAMVGFAHGGRALAAYYKSFSDGKGPARVGGVTSMHVDHFKNWLRDGDTKKALCDQDIKKHCDEVKGYAKGGPVVHRFKNYVPPVQSVKHTHYRDQPGIDDGTLSTLRSMFRMPG